MGNRGIEVPSTAREREFSLIQSAQIGSGAYLALYWTGTRRNGEVGVLQSGQGEQSVKLTPHVHVVLRLRISCITPGLPYATCTVTSTWRKDEIWQRSAKHVEVVVWNYKMDKVITTRKEYDNHGTAIVLLLFGSKYFGTWGTCGYRDGVMTTQAFWDTISRRLVNNYWRLGAAQCFHL